MSKNGLDFQVGDHVVYPAHGVGQVQAVETQDVAGLSLEVHVITFDHEKMTLRVPTGKARSSGLRSLAEGDVVSQALNTLKGRARVKRTMWSRRAQEYEAKINSGDLISIAEVVRDLHRAENQPEQSYSERQLYESALDRMAREVAAIEQIDRDAAIVMLNKSLLVKAASAAA
ncbi:MAG: CarD family transcriptional regulator [Phenylobacterium sp.]|nr:CarD family transcriptional regulator [Phenylobacterium sp.]